MTAEEKEIAVLKVQVKNLQKSQVVLLNLIKGLFGNILYLMDKEEISAVEVRKYLKEEDEYIQSAVDYGCGAINAELTKTFDSQYEATVKEIAENVEKCGYAFNWVKKE